MNKKLLITAILATLSLPAYAGVYKCGNIYQQSPCGEGQKVIEITKDTNEMSGKNLPPLEYKILPITFTSEEMIERSNKAKNFITQSLKDPESVRFRNIKIFQVKHLGGIDTFVCGEVNAKNSYGGYNGFKNFVTHNSRLDANEIVGGIGEYGSIVSIRVDGKSRQYDADDRCLIQGTPVE